MAYQYNYGPGPGEAFYRGIQAAFGAYDAQKQRQRLREDDAWRKELRDHERGLMPIQRESAQIGLDAARVGLQGAERQHDWAGEDRPFQVRARDRADELGGISVQSARRKGEAEALDAAFAAMELGDGEKAKQEYLLYDPNYKGAAPVADPNNEGYWLIDTDGDGKVESVNPTEMRKKIRSNVSSGRTGLSANADYLRFVADNVFGGDMKKAYESINSMKSKDPREWVAKIMATNPYMDIDEAMEKAHAIVNYDPTQQLPAPDPEPSPEDRPSMLDRIWGIFGGAPDQSQEREANAGLSATGIQKTNPAAGELPPQAAAQLKEGANTRFANGQVWTLRNGQPVRVQ